MKKDNSSGFGIIGLLGVLFVGLKLAGVISWSWWYVLLPFYAGLLIGLAALFIILVFSVIAGLFEL